MLITRTTDGGLVNRVMNESSGQQWVDLAPIAADPRCYCLTAEPPLGMHICIRVIEGVYEVHSTFTPEGRGEWGIEFSAAAIRWMFCVTECIELLARIPQGSAPTRVLAHQFGFTRRWTGASMRHKDRTVPYDVLSLTMMEWMPAEAGAFEAVLADMRAADNQAKAMFWQIRRTFVSRSVN